MLINPKSGLREGDHVNIELLFDNGEAIRVNAVVRSAREGRRKGQHH
jgi:copper(I)-binding protein